MRILRFLLSSLVVLAIVGVLGFLATREILLFLGVSKIRESLSGVRQLRLGPGSIAPQCQASAISDPAGAVVESINLTFTSDTEYQLEIICRIALRKPVVLNEYQLPPFVKKLPGKSGLEWMGDPTGITLEVWGRRRSIMVKGQDVSYVNGDLEANIATGPLTRCEGYGYVCCYDEAGIGKDPRVTQATDCPLSCFSSCESRPVVLSLNTQPFYDVETRTVNLKTGEQVTVSYVIDPGPGQTADSTLDYGDGVTETSTKFANSFTHTYDCPTDACEYQVTVTAKDGRGNPSAVTPVSQLTVRVSGI